MAVPEAAERWGRSLEVGVGRADCHQPAAAARWGQTRPTRRTARPVGLSIQDIPLQRLGFIGSQAGRADLLYRHLPRLPRLRIEELQRVVQATHVERFHG